MFASSAKALLYLKAHTLEIYLRGVEEVGKIEFPSVVLNHLEIIDQVKLNELIISFIAKTGLEKYSAIILLSDEVTFHKLFDRDTPAKEEEMVEAFFDKVPLDKTKISKKIVPVGDKILAVACNSNLYETIKNSLEGNDWKIEAIVPSSVFGDLPGTLNPELVEQIFSTGDLIEKGDLLKSDSPKTSSSEVTDASTPKKSPLKKILIALVVLILVVTVSLFILIRMGVIKSAFIPFGPKEAPTVSATPTPTNASNVTEVQESTKSAESTSSAQPAFNREDINFQVLNGSERAGLASTVRDDLLALGYTDVEVGNAEEATTSSTVRFNPTVDVKFKVEILKDLKTIFDKVVESPIEAGDFAAIITIGRDF